MFMYYGTNKTLTDEIVSEWRRIKAFMKIDDTSALYMKITGEKTSIRAVIYIAGFYYGVEWETYALYCLSESDRITYIHNELKKTLTALKEWIWDALITDRDLCTIIQDFMVGREALR